MVASEAPLDQIALQGLLEKVFKDLTLDPQYFEVQLSVPRVLGDRTAAAVASILFEEFGVRAVNVGHQTSFAFHAYNAPSGVMVDLGERMDVVPVVGGRRVAAGVSRSHVGGSQMRRKLQRYLLGRNYTLSSFLDGYVARYGVEKMGYIAEHFDRELDK